MSEQNKALVRRFLEEVDKGEIAVLDRNIDPKYSDHNPPPFPGLAAGLHGAKQAFTMALAAFQDFHHVVEDQVAEGDRVVSRITAWGTHTGDLLGIPPTQKKVSMAGIAMHRIVNGKLVEHWATIDAFGLLQQLGAAPVAPIAGSPGVFAAKPHSATIGAGGRSTPEANKALVRRFVEEHDRQKGPPAELSAPSYTSYVPGSPPMDLQADRQMSGAFYAAFPDMKHVVEDLVAEGDKVGTRGTITGTHRGDLMGIPSTGKRVAIQAMGIACVANSKITEVWFVFDQLGMMVQLGVVPPPGQAR